MKNLAQSLARVERPFASRRASTARLCWATLREGPIGVAAPAIGSGDPDRKILVGPCVGRDLEDRAAARLQKIQARAYGWSEERRRNGLGGHSFVP